MLSKKSKYGLKAMLELAAVDAGQKPIQASELAERQRLPKKFLEAILLELTRHGLLQSKLGRGGGYVLARRPGDITIGEVIRVLEGPLALIPCVSKTAYRRCEECVDESKCGTRIMMRQVWDAMAGILDATTLASICDRVKEESSAEELMYHI